MDTTENRTEQYTVIEKKASELKCGDTIRYAQEWKLIVIVEFIEMLRTNYPKNIFLVRLPSPPMEVKDAEAFVNKKDFKRNADFEGYYVINDKDMIRILTEFSQLQAPVISAEEFLKEKGIAVDMNLNTCTKKPPKIKLTDLLNEYRNL